jgi:threonine synthase
MDIQVSSNFERLLFELHGRDSEAVKRMMSGLKQSGSFTIADKPLGRLRKGFSADRASEAETAAAIKDVLENTGYLMDPHTAVGVHVARKHNKQGCDCCSAEAPMVVLSTAHPAKFPAAVEEASGQYPDLPLWLSDLMDREEKFDVLENSMEDVEAFILKHARAAQQK